MNNHPKYGIDGKNDTKHTAWGYVISEPFVENIGTIGTIGTNPPVMRVNAVSK